MLPPDTVLIVDDEPIVLDVLKVALGKKGLTVKTAMRMKEALALLAAEPFGCLMVDKNLQDGTGLDLIRKVRETQPFCACLVMTGYPNVESILEALRLGAVDYLEKPFPQMSIVQEKVQKAIERQRLAAERDALVKAVQKMRAELSARQSADFKAETELEMLQNVMQLRIDEATQALTDARARAEAERADLTTQLESLQSRNAKAIDALRIAQAGVGAILEGFHKPGEREAQLENLKRILTDALALLTSA